MKRKFKLISIMTVVVCVLSIFLILEYLQAKPHTYKGENYPEGRYPQKIKDGKYPRTYYPNTEILGKDEMRITALGTGMPNQSPSNVAASFLVELGNGESFLFDLGTGATDRLFGYLDALAAHGLPKDERLVRYGDFDYESGRQAACALLTELEDLPTAIFAASDVVAIGAMSKIQELGYRIPQDIAMAGFDDVPTARYLNPPLTTARLPAAELGRRAGEVLLNCIRGSSLTRHQVLLDTELIVRQSSCSVV